MVPGCGVAARESVSFPLFFIEFSSFFAVRVRESLQVAINHSFQLL